MPRFPHACRGISLIELLVTLLVLAVGLLGAMGLQARLQQSEMETYQRAQALLLLGDMAARLEANRNHADAYEVASLGTGMTCPTTTATQLQRDMTEWCAALQGATETVDTTRTGGLIGGRGCIEALDDGQYLITVAWQGLLPLGAPPAGIACGEGEYDGPTGSPCVDDLCRRAVSTIVRVGTL